jgi:hypothetical protein
MYPIFLIPPLLKDHRTTITIFILLSLGFTRFLRRKVGGLHECFHAAGSFERWWSSCESNGRIIEFLQGFSKNSWKLVCTKLTVIH